MEQGTQRNIFQFLENEVEENVSDYVELQPVQPIQDAPHEVRIIENDEAPHFSVDTVPTDSLTGVETMHDLSLASVETNELSFDLLEESFPENENDEDLTEDDIHDMSSDEEEFPSILNESDPEEIEEEEEEQDHEIDVQLPTPLVGYFIGKDGTAWSKEPIAQPLQKKKLSNVFRPVKSHIKNVRNVSSVADTFSLFFTDSTLLNIVNFTNLEGQRLRGSRWVKTDIVELKALIGLYYHLGERKLNLMDAQRIWGGIGDPVAKATMTMKRFYNLSNAMRFDDKETRSARRERDCFAPIRDLFDTVNQKLDSFYIPDMNLTVDEQLIPWRGRVKFLMYLPSKPDKYGIKIFWICDSATAYPLNGIPYLGRFGERRMHLGRETVQELVQPYLKSGRNVTFDNFFSDKELLLWLTKYGLSCVGTVRRDKRFLPDNFRKGQDLKKGESCFAFTEDMTIVSYKSNHKKMSSS